MFVGCGGVGITKDVGQIPQALAKYHGYHSYFVTYKGCDFEPWTKKYAPNITIRYLRNISNNEFLSELFYIFKNAKQIDVLQIYHFLIIEIWNQLWKTFCFNP